MINCTRRIEFDAGHRVIDHDSKCKFLHGHRYILEVTANSEELNELGMVVDFSVIKEKMQTWVNKNLDHTIILSIKDKALGEQIESYTKQKVYYINSNPTAENIALHIKRDIIPKLFYDVSFVISKIKLFETPNCFVEV